MISRRTRAWGLVATLAAALAITGATAAVASAATKTFSNPTPITIPDVGPSPPYPSNIAVTGFAGNVQKVTATIHNFTHTHPDDIAALLVGPDGTNSILMGRSGGGSDPGVVTVTFDQAAASGTPDPITSGTFRPTLDQNHTTQPLTPPAPGGPYQADLNLFNGKPANGTWQLYVDDQAGGDQGSIGGGWSLNVTAAVNTVKAGKPKLNKKKGTARLPVTVGDAGKVTLKGKGVKAASKTTAGPGTVNLTVKPKGSTASQLNSTGSATVKVKVTFTPNGGASKTVKKKIKLKKTL